MKKISILLLLMGPVILQFCSTSKNAAKINNITYTANIKPLMETHCTPCHFPPKGNKKAYDNYTAVKSDIDSILNRVNKNPGDKGFMPFKHPKLPDSTINVLAQWRSNGMPEN